MNAEKNGRRLAIEARSGRSSAAFPHGMLFRAVTTEGEVFYLVADDFAPAVRKAEDYCAKDLNGHLDSIAWVDGDFIG